MTTTLPTTQNSLAANNTTPVNNGAALHPVNNNEEPIFGIIYLSNAKQEGLCELFNGYAIKIAGQLPSGCRRAYRIEY